MKELSKALVKFQSVVPTIPKKHINPFFSQGGKKAMYADLATIIDTCKESLANCGLCISQTMLFQDGVTLIKTSLIHTSGELIESIMPLPAIQDAQKLTAAVTYFRRTQYASILGVCPDDDSDGNELVQSKPNATEVNQVVQNKVFGNPTNKPASAAQLNALKKMYPEKKDWENLTDAQARSMFDEKKK